MEKQKRWHLYLIIAVLALTLYNILPTIFFYSKPLASPIDAPRAEKVAAGVLARVNNLADSSKQWLASFCDLIGIKPLSIDLDPNNEGLIAVSFKNENDAQKFSKFLGRAGQQIPFAPARLQVFNQDFASENSKVFVKRNVDNILDPAVTDQLFDFIAKYNDDGSLNSAYIEMRSDRVSEIVNAANNNSAPLSPIAVLMKSPTETPDEAVISFAREISELESAVGSQSAILKRYLRSLNSSADTGKQKVSYSLLTEKLVDVEKKLLAANKVNSDEKKSRSDNGLSEDTNLRQEGAVLNSQLKAIESASKILAQHKEMLVNSEASSNLEKDTVIALNGKSSIEDISLEGKNPFFKSLTVNWESGDLFLNPYDDIVKFRSLPTMSEKDNYAKDVLNRYLINEVAEISAKADEKFKPYEDSFTLKLDSLPNSLSYLNMNLAFLAKLEAEQIKNQLLLSWSPDSQDLQADNYPIRSYQQFLTESPEQQQLGLVVYAPVLSSDKPASFKNGSIYVIAKGMSAILANQAESDETSQQNIAKKDFQKLSENLYQLGFISYAGSDFTDLPEQFKSDHIFEFSNYFGMLLKATRENFNVHGSKQFATLDFSDVEQRILTVNKIEDQEQEDLLKWREAYTTSQADINGMEKYTVPAPIKNAYIQNILLSAKKYFRGDDRKILKWGLDLSGGKTVRIGLTDNNGRAVTDPDDLNQAVNELYTRINKMGVAERTIRIENSNIILDFPGSQNLSASELIKASAMYFHIVNEKFTANNGRLAGAVNQFLQNIWNEAVVTNRKDIDSINEIAWRHLGGDLTTGAETAPRSESAQILYESGLRLANPFETIASSEYNDTLSKIAIFRNDELEEQEVSAIPLIIVFNNYALEGSNLENVSAGYDSTQGNILTFGVKKSFEDASNSGSPREIFYRWTSQFSEEKVAGTVKEQYSRGRGWRMAVVLNGSIVTSPTLNAALKDGGTISGRFSQREVNQLAADLKAGSLSFTPKILSEENVSPELGLGERTSGIVASIIAIILVVITMVAYYRFAGVVASAAVILNILIMWGVLQNIGAVLTLPGIAGIVLTIGMAVDANVLVFERIREEFANSGRITSAIQAGYRKAFSAIMDSNVTTIIAALILIQFDSGPIKGFAVTLIIGIASSMFTALFLTRYFFAGWAKNPSNKALNMANIFQKPSYDFLKMSKLAIIASGVFIVIGSLLFLSEYKTIFGMDFTGGYSLTVDLKSADATSDTDYRELATEALLAAGASRTDFEIRELSRPDHLRIQFGTSMDERGHPFYTMVSENNAGNFKYDYQKNSKLSWVVQSLESKGLTIQKDSLAHPEKNWSVMSSQFSDSMKNNAIIGLLIALAAILIYITARFEFKFAISAVAGLTHDVLITMGLLAILNLIGIPVKIDLQVVGAIMTIIGYSLNDTIIVFDRVREDQKVFRKFSFKEVINHALNITLSRTVMTSGTTLLVLISLVLLGGPSIFAFSLVMTIGVLVGTLSSLFIAPPILLYFHNKELREAGKEIKERYNHS